MYQVCLSLRGMNWHPNPRQPFQQPFKYLNYFLYIGQNEPCSVVAKLNYSFIRYIDLISNLDLQIDRVKNPKSNGQ
jgi:hypothetical protein